MPRIKLSNIIHSTADHLFTLSEDYKKRLQWDPFMKEMEFLDGSSVMGKNVKTVTTAYNGMKMETVFIAHQRPEVIAMQMIKGPFIFKSMSGTWRFKSIDENLTEVVFIYHFTTKPAFIAWLLNPVISAILKRDMQKRMSSLKKAAETHA